jgi:DNA-binding HxlR family transcriptional regulator
MLNRTYEGQLCSVARALETIGERWSLLIVRDVFIGIRRFDEIQADLGIARNILQTRLELLCEEDVLRRHRYQERPARYEYRLTRKGVDLWPVLMTMMQWGDRYYAKDGPPRIIKHQGCGGRVREGMTCSKCKAELRPQEVYWEWGPGAPSEVKEQAAVGAGAA